MTDDNLNINIRLVPTIIIREMPTDPINHTEMGMFNLCTYLVPVNVKGGAIDKNTGELIPTDVPMFALYANLFWMGIVVQKHMVIITSEDGENNDYFDDEEGRVHSMIIHANFGMYMEGVSEIFPSFRAFGWAFVPFNEVMAIQMWEQRAIQQALNLGVFDFDNMLDWAVFLNILNADEEELNQIELLGEGDEQIGDISFTTHMSPEEEDDLEDELIKRTDTILDNPDPLGVNLNSNVRGFLDQLEKGLDDDETDGTT